VYHASVLFVDNEADLALVGVTDPKFMADIKPMSIGETPDVQDDVIAVGYPTGGNDISYTRGIVSRIEDIRYSHSLSQLLGI
jgi:S1-C subfamily serine protease